MSLEPKPATDASLGQLMSEFSSQTSRLVRDEMRLAQKEFQESAKHAGIGAGLLSVAGCSRYLGSQQSSPPLSQRCRLRCPSGRPH